MLLQALDHAARPGVLIVAAAGNQGAVGGTIITAHPWVVPVGACDLRGARPSESNLDHSIGRNGLLAPGEQVTSLGSEGDTLTLGGTSAAAPFVTGAIALIWSLFPAASGAELRLATLKAHARTRPTVTPPLLKRVGGLSSHACSTSDEVTHERGQERATRPKIPVKPTHTDCAFLASSETKKSVLATWSKRRPTPWAFALAEAASAEPQR